MTETNVEFLQSQLIIARNEINKLRWVLKSLLPLYPNNSEYPFRQQVKNLTHVQRKDIASVNQLLNNFKCQNCRQQEDNTKNQNLRNQESVSDGVEFRPIGVIRTGFAEKRAVPRQPSVGSRLKGKIDISADVFTNPEHSLEGLDEFSHLWILYHFHKNTSHPKAKVSPPRLKGERVGVFSTRSPHRPCPIGLSLVEIDKIENSAIYFSGTDMVDGTPVLDIKPYIPFYDAPNLFESGKFFWKCSSPWKEMLNCRTNISWRQCGLLQFPSGTRWWGVGARSSRSCGSTTTFEFPVKSYSTSDSCEGSKVDRQLSTPVSVLQRTSRGSAARAVHRSTVYRRYLGGRSQICLLAY